MGMVIIFANTNILIFIHIISRLTICSMMKFSLAIILFVAVSVSNGFMGATELGGYILAPKGDTECPQGFSKITDPAECVAAAPALGFNFTDKGKCAEYKGKWKRKCTGQPQVCSYCTGCKKILKKIGETSGGIVRFSSAFNKKAFLVCSDDCSKMARECRATQFGAAMTTM